MKVLIIGGTGNISHAITKNLLGRGVDITLYNRGNEPMEGARSIAGDRTNHAVFEEQIKTEGDFDCVIDMINYHPDDAKSAVRAFRGRTRQFIFCSTVDVYTKPAKQYPIKEDFERKPNPEFPYAYEKTVCENIFEEANARGDFALTVIRPAATYNDTWTPISLMGPGNTLLKRIRAGKPVIVLGDGTSFWSSCHRDDVGRAFAHAVGNDATFGKAYNVTADEWMTWEEYFSTAARMMSAPAIEFVRIPADFLAKMAPKSAEWCLLNFQFNNIFDNSAAKKDLQFQYSVPWAEGVRKMVEYHDRIGDIDHAPEYPFYDSIIERYVDSMKKLAAELSPLDF